MMELKKYARKYLRNLPGFREVFNRIDTAYRERDQARVERDAALAQAGLPQIPFFAPPGHFYSPIVDPKRAGAHFDRMAALPAPDSLPGIDLDRSELRTMWQALLPYLISCPFAEERQSGLRYCYENPNYSYGDGSILHAMLRHFKPRRVIEVGSGWSSACMIDTVEKFREEVSSQLTFIEPYPQLLESLIGTVNNRVRIFECEVQQVPLSTFDELEANDVLFIDSSHVLSTGSDVCFELFEILPRLRPGVVVHFHDAFWPFEYPRGWAVDENRSWNEIYGLRAFLTGNREWKILFFSDYFRWFEAKEIAETFPLFLRNAGGALWLMKK